MRVRGLPEEDATPRPLYRMTSRPAGKGGGLKVGDAVALHDPLTD